MTEVMILPTTMLASHQVRNSWLQLFLSTTGSMLRSPTMWRQKSRVNAFLRVGFCTVDDTHVFELKLMLLSIVAMTYVAYIVGTMTKTSNWSYALVMMYKKDWAHWIISNGTWITALSKLKESCGKFCVVISFFKKKSLPRARPRPIWKSLILLPTS